MVHLVDEGSHFEVPIEQVWKLNEDHATNGHKIHPNMKNQKYEEINENTMHFSWDTEMNGQMVHNKAKITNYAPVGTVLELVEGPMAGSTIFNFYTPKGNRTAVTVVGNFKSEMMPEEMLKQAAQQFLDTAHNEDKAYLQTAKM